MFLTPVPALFFTFPQPAPLSVPTDWVGTLHWRQLGPPTMGGRIVGLAVNEADPSNYWVATASGGLLKTTNNGTTFEHQFDHESSISIGSVAVAPSDPKIVWVGTGENNPRNSVSYGDGVYKSTDGGKSWTNMGLRGTFQTGDIVIDPRDPNTVYVGALGRLYGSNEERGLYKTTDGGKTWTKILYFDDKTGVIDIALKPDDPNTLLVAMWERKRDGFDSYVGGKPPEGTDGYDPEVKWGKHAGIYKSTDGGKSWKKLTKGLPSSKLGRIGLDFYKKNPNTVFAIVDCEKIGMGPQPRSGALGALGVDEKPGVPGRIKLTQLTKGGAAEMAGLKVGDILLSFGEEVLGYNQLAAQVRDKNPGDSVPVKLLRDGKEQTLLVVLGEAAPGEETPTVGGILGAFAQEGEGGMAVRFVRADSAAEKAGLEEGDLIKAAGGKATPNNATLLAALTATKLGEKLTLTVVREGKEQALTVERAKPEPPKRPYGYMYLGQAPNVMSKQGPDGAEYGGVYRSDDAGETWRRVNSVNPRPMYFSQIRVDPTNDQNLFVLGVDLLSSKDGGKTFTTGANNRIHPDQHAFWIDPRDGRHLLMGCDGGTYTSYDQGTNWEHIAHFAIGQAYHVSVSPEDPYQLLAGFQDNGSWVGPSNTLRGVGATNTDWRSVSSGDGFQTLWDKVDPEWVYTESQDGGMVRSNLRTGDSIGIGPRREPSKKFYFNWNTPIALSRASPSVFYAAGNYVFKSESRGQDLRLLSPKLGRSDRGTATALAESPLDRAVLWAGTDDGNLWVTRDGGATWKEVGKNLKVRHCVATIEASRSGAGRAYVALDGHRTNDDKPYVFVTEDFGETWTALSGGLPPFGSTRCLREDPLQPDLLFCGTEFAAFMSVNRGQTWTKLNSNLPTVAVHEFAFAPQSSDMIAATHGRSLWALDIAPLRELAKGLTQSGYLYPVSKVVRWRQLPNSESYGGGAKRFAGELPPRGAQILYSLTKKATSIKLSISDVSGQTVWEVDPKTVEPGLYRVEWNTGRSGRGGQVPAGVYRATLEVDGKAWSQLITVERDPALKPGEAEPDFTAPPKSNTEDDNRG